MGGRILFFVVRNLVVGFSKVFWRVSMSGLENLPKTGAYVLSPVHRSNIDSLVVTALSRRRLRAMGKHTLWKRRLPGAFLTALGGFPVERGSADREALRKCIDAVRGGEPLLVFPEGTRQSGPEVQPLFEGAAYVASRTGVPIVPVGIGGSEAAMPKGSKLIRPVKVHMEVGPPIRVEGAADGGRAPRRAVHEATTALAAELQRLFDIAQTKAGAR